MDYQYICGECYGSPHGMMSCMGSLLEGEARWVASSEVWMIMYIGGEDTLMVAFTRILRMLILLSLSR